MRYLFLGVFFWSQIGFAAEPDCELALQARTLERLVVKIFKAQLDRDASYSLRLTSANLKVAPIKDILGDAGLKKLGRPDRWRQPLIVTPGKGDSSSRGPSPKRPHILTLWRGSEEGEKNGSNCRYDFHHLSDQGRSHFAVQCPRRQMTQRSVIGLMADLMHESEMILIIDDDDSIRETLKFALEVEGYQVFDACNGQEAIELLARIPRPQLILLDLMMPVMDGREFATLMANDLALEKIPIVLLTAAVSRAKTIGHVMGILKKPLSLNSLLDTVQRHCRGRSENGSSPITT